MTSMKILKRKTPYRVRVKVMVKATGTKGGKCSPQVEEITGLKLRLEIVSTHAGIESRSNNIELNTFSNPKFKICKESSLILPQISTNSLLNNKIIQTAYKI